MVVFTAAAIIGITVAAIVVGGGGTSVAVAAIVKTVSKCKSRHDSPPDSHRESPQSTPSTNCPERTQLSSVRSRKRNLSSKKSPSLGRSTKYMQVSSVRNRHSSLLPQGVTKRHSRVLDQETTSNLDCIVIPSFGDSLPHGAVAKKESAFLPGVGTDLNIIQKLIGQDTQKTLSHVRQGYRDHQKGTCKELIEDEMKTMKLKKSQNGLLIWYTGHGKQGTGNWALGDGETLKFRDIYDLYKNYFKGRPLYIVSDCCYSGAWVKECADLLDRDGIKCGHDAKCRGILIKVFAACLPNESAYDKLYARHDGTKMYTYNGSQTIRFAKHRRLYFEEDSQTTLGVDFTQDTGCLIGESGKCLCSHSTWPKYVDDLLKEPESEEYLP